MMKYLIIFLTLCCVTFISCSSSIKELNEDNGVSIASSYSPVYPVLIGKQINPVFRIEVDLEQNRKGTIQGLVLDMRGTTSIDEIKGVAIYYTASKESFSTNNLFAETNKVAQKIMLTGDQELSIGSNYFWLSVTLMDDTNLDHEIQAVIKEAEVNSSTIKVPPSIEETKKRVGHALRQHNDDNVHTYRIPGMATTNNGTLIAVYDIRINGSVDLQEDIDVGMSRSIDNGQTWEAMKTIMDMGEWGGLSQKENGVGDPSILVDHKTNTIWVSALWLHGHPDKRAWFASQPGLTPEETGQFLLVKSEDDGLTWSDPINVTTQFKNPKWQLLLDGPGKGIMMEDGTLVFPAQFKDHIGVPHSTIIYSKDRGETWSIGTGAKTHTTEAQVVELSDGTLMLNMRDDRGSGPNGRNGTGARSVYTTSDLGQTWIEHPTSRKDLPESVCMASLIKHTYQGKELLIFSNPADQYLRQNMTIKISEDDGLTWNEKYYTLIDEGKGRGYSCMTSIGEEVIGIIYEGSQADMVFQRIRLSDLYDSK